MKRNRFRLAVARLEHLLDHDNSAYVMISCSAECTVEPYVHAGTEDDAVRRWNRRDGTGTECPFCGSAPDVHTIGKPESPSWVARCSIKPGPYRKCVMASIFGDTVDEALTSWARRAYTETP